MRKNIKALAPTLWLVIAAFIITIFAVWGGAGRLGGGRAAKYIAHIGKEKIPVEIYRNTLIQRLQMLRNQSKKELNRKIIEQLNLPQQILSQMIQERLVLHLAKEMGLGVTDQEIRDKILSYEAFQRNGKFIGFEEYKKILSWNRISVEEFERGLRKEIIINKVIQLLTAGLPVTDQEVLENYKRENESARLEYLTISTERIELEREPDDNQLKQYFALNPKKYKIPEKRKGILVFFKIDDLKSEFKVTDQDIEKYYQENISRFEIPEKIKVSRIYLPYEEQDKEKLKEKARNILEKIKEGEDFALLAKVYSQDEKKDQGGDWGLYEWRRLSAEEQKSIQDLPQGETSDLIELKDGLSIIKITEKEPSYIRPLQEVKEMIKDTILFEKAGELAENKIKELEKEAKKEKSLKKAAEKMNFKVEFTEFLTKGEAIKDIDPSGAISQNLFKIKEKEISLPIYTYQGIGLVELEKIQPSRQAKFEEVKDKVKNDLKEKMKKEQALKLANQIKRELNKKEMRKVSEEFNVNYQKEDKFQRGRFLTEVGINPEIEKEIFSIEVNKVSGPLGFDKGYILIKVLERKEINLDEFRKNKEKEREKLRTIKRNQFLNSYLSKLMEQLGIKINSKAFEEVNNDILSRFE